MLRKGLPLTLLLVAISGLGVAQNSPCREDFAGYLVRSVKISGRRPPALDLPLKAGDQFSPAALGEARNVVRQAVNAEKKDNGDEFIKLGKTPLVEVAMVTSCAKPAPAEACRAAGLGDKCIDVSIKPFALSVDTTRVGSVWLPLPRSDKFSFLSRTPRPLRVFNPQIGLGYDRDLGAAPSLETETDLLDLFGSPAAARRDSLKIQIKGRQSLTEPFYNAAAKLTWQRDAKDESFDHFAFAVGFGADREPTANGPHLRNAVTANGKLGFTSSFGVASQITAEFSYSRASQRLYRPGQTAVLTREDAFAGRVISDGRLFKGFLRAAAWVEGGKPKNISGSYRRAVAWAGYEKEMPVGGEQTLGLEVSAGWGRASRRTPEYARFFGGNSLNTFLYEAADESSLSRMPAGPLLRSFGRRATGATQTNGATSFQNFNLTLSLPVKRFSYPLIPNEVVDVDDMGRVLTLRGLIKDFAVDSGQELLSLHYQEEGLEIEEAERKAAQVFQGIRPGVNFLVDYAKIYAVKPLILFDAARLSRPGFPARTNYSLGGGVQLTIVVAKFELGYAHTLRRLSGEPRGNLVARLVFENLF